MAGMGAARWKRLQRIRSLEEQQARAELARANQALATAETAVGEQLRQRTAALRAARQALLAGERSEWQLAEAVREVSEWNLERLQATLEERTAAAAVRRTEYTEKRREEEQVKSLHAKRMAADEEERRRAEQTAADEWFSQRRQRDGTDG